MQSIAGGGGRSILAGAARTVFSIDLRSLAAFRIAIATLLLIDLAWRAWDAEAFLSDGGVLPRVVFIDLFGPHSAWALDRNWSLHLLSGQTWLQLLLLAVAGWFAVWLLVGYRTRLAAAASWLLLGSVVNRNPLVADAGDAVLRCMLLWALFLPLGARCGVDAVHARLAGRAGGAPREPDPDAAAIVSFGSAAALLQLLAVYVSAAVYKLDPVWTRDLSGVYYALHCDAFATSWGLYLRQYPVVMQVLTAGTLALEWGGPILLLSPWGNRWIRCAAVVAFSAFHVGLAATMTLGLFPWICIASWLLFIPGVVWDRLGGSGGRSRAGVMAAVAQRRAQVRLLRTGWCRRAEHPRLRPGATGELVAGMLLLCAGVWNVWDLAGGAGLGRFVPEALDQVCGVVGLAKGWAMFAPVPHRDDGWPIVRGTLHDGTEVNLWEPGRPLPWDKPRVVSALYHRQRWRRCVENLTMEASAWHRPYFADFLQRRWNRQYAAGRPQREVAKVELLRRLEPTPPPGEPFLPLETVTLWTRYYSAE